MELVPRDALASGFCPEFPGGNSGREGDGDLGKFAGCTFPTSGFLPGFTPLGMAMGSPPPQAPLLLGGRPRALPALGAFLLQLPGEWED